MKKNIIDNLREPIIPIQNACCFIGIEDLTEEQITKVKRALTVRIAKLYNDDFKIFVSGGERGFDMIATEYVLALKENRADIQVLLIERSPQHTKNWSIEDVKRFIDIRLQVDQIIVAYPKPLRATYINRNYKMLDLTGYCLGAWRSYDRVSMPEKSYRYAQAKQYPFINLL